jgi:hypothetical protein
VVTQRATGGHFHFSSLPLIHRAIEHWLCHKEHRTHYPLMDGRIEKWQRSVSDGLEPSTSNANLEEGPASRLGTTAAALFSTLLDDSSDKAASNSIVRALEHEYAYFRLWDDSYGLATGDLDRTLSQSRRVKRLTCRLLASLCRTLAKSEWPSVYTESREFD